MPDTRVILFWMGGILAQPISSLIQDALAKYGRNDANLLSIPGFANSSERLALGQLDDLAFCQGICDTYGVNVSMEAFRDTVITSFVPCPEVIRTIAHLPEDYSRWLIVDYPRTWFDQVKERLMIPSCFSIDHILFLQESGLYRLIPNIFDFLANKTRYPQDQCLIFDADSHRTIAALIHGFPSAIYVDPKRLEREFALRHFTAKVPLEHRPPTVL
jgi:hypothetical protein